MSIFEQFETNPEAEVKGVPFKFKPNKDGTIPTFVCARMGGANQAKWAQAYTQAWANHRAQQEAGTVSDHDKRVNSVMAFVDGVLRGWSNIQDKNGKPISFSRDAAYELFMKLPELLDTLQTLVIGREEFLKHQEEVAEKN